MKPPDVIVTVSDSIAIFEPQTRPAADWLKEKFHTDFDNMHDQMYVDARKYREIVSALRQAGFTVLT